MSDNIASAVLKPKEERRLLRGHLWGFRNEFQQLPQLEDGAVMDVFSANRRFIGRGFYQAQGGIAARLLSPHQENIDADFLAARIEAARAFRQRMFPESKVYRWVFGESDGLPGLVADRYGSVVVAETSCAFYARWKQAFADALLAQEDISGVLLSVGGEESVFGEVPEVLVCELDGLQLQLPLQERQKTGLFLDQRLNRHTVRQFARGARVFDGFCHHGFWALEAARAGAAAVIGVDSSAAAIAAARENAQLNNVETNTKFEVADVEAALGNEAALDLIILDPPAFARSRAHVTKALRRYQALNELAMKRLNPGGILITCSCSHFVEAPAFLETLKRAAAAAKRPVWVLEQRGASPDHPVLLAMPETAYLKCLLLRVL